MDFIASDIRGNPVKKSSPIDNRSEREWHLQVMPIAIDGERLSRHIFLDRGDGP